MFDRILGANKMRNKQEQQKRENFHPPFEDRIKQNVI